MGEGGAAMIVWKNLGWQMVASGEGWLALALMVVSLTKVMGNFWYFLQGLSFYSNMKISFISFIHNVNEW